MSYGPPPGYPPPPGAYPPPGPYGPPPSNNQKALWAMILGIVGLVCCGLLAGIPALILGTIGRREIAQSYGRQTGGGMATAGIVLGILSIVMSIVSGILYATGVLEFDFSTS